VGWDDELVPIPDCPLHLSEMNGQLEKIRALVPGHFPLVNLMVSGRAYTLVLKCKRRPELIETMRGWNLPGISLFVNWNPVAGRRAIDSRRTELVSGEEWLADEGLIYGPTSFRQQIPGLENFVIEEGRKYLAGPVVLDFYCGTGATLKAWRAAGWETLGVELHGESLACAGKNAPGVSLLRGKVEDRLPQVEEYLTGRPFSLYTNPPRTGHAREVVEWTLRARPEKIVYLSCNPRSLGRDLRQLSKGYTVERVQPLDFFPQTSHVETMVFLRRA
jgi:23S rRNA (uracil1939-C5)-methyltransferase